MKILGLTGSMGMGKSTIAKIFRERGIAVWDADATVHDLYDTNDDLKSKIKEAFGDVITGFYVDRKKLTEVLKVKEDGFKILNGIVGPFLEKSRQEFLKENKTANLVVIDVPLLYEMEMENGVDFVLLVTAPSEIQKERVMKRSGMTEEKFAMLKSQQFGEDEKRSRADFIVDTSKDLMETRQEVNSLINILNCECIR